MPIGFVSDDLEVEGEGVGIKFSAVIQVVLKGVSMWVKV